MANTVKKTGVSNTSPVKNKEQKIKYVCYKCGASSVMDRFANMVKSELYESMNYRLPICKHCLDERYQMYLNVVCDGNEEEAVKIICSMYDIYFNPEIFIGAKNFTGDSIITNYLKAMNTPKFIKHRGKTYVDTLIENRVIKEQIEFENNEIQVESAVDDSTRRFFGKGFTDEDYQFLQEQYDDWTTRHECKTKAQEEIFKRICFKQLEILKATKVGNDTKDLDNTFQSLLDTAKLKPKQNTADTMSDAQTFGTLIDKYENTRPLPEIDEDLKDVDKIGLYLDVFFKGHLAKMMGLKNGLSNLYSKFIKKYTVEKPEYKNDEDSEALFDAIFGNSTNMED